MFEALSEYMNTMPLFTDEKFIAAFVDENPDYYVAKFRLLKEGKNFVGFNVPALLVPMLWLTYRKLYAYAFLFFIIQQFIILGVLGHFLSNMAFIQEGPKYFRPLILNLSQLPFYFFVSFYANKIYLLRANQTITNLSVTLTNEASLIEAAKKSGGTSNFACFLVVLVLLIVNLATQYAKFT